MGRVTSGLLWVAACLAAAGAAAEGDGRDGTPSTLVTKTVLHEGIERTYHVRVPRGFTGDEPAPLVLALHGGGGEGRRFDRSATGGTLTRAADRRGVVLVFPEGIDRRWSDGRMEHLENGETHDDVGFISAVIDRMTEEYGIDALRIYATGISNGGFMSIRLAMDLSARLAAVAPVTAQLSKALEGREPAHPISIMIVNGTEDRLVPFEGGHVRLFGFGRSRGEILSTEATIERFVRSNECPDAPRTTTLPDREPDGTVVETTRYAGCGEGSEIALVKVVGGGHTWPGGYQYLPPRLVGKVSRDVNASEMILDFFLAHSLRGRAPR